MSKNEIDSKWRWFIGTSTIEKLDEHSKTDLLKANQIENNIQNSDADIVAKLCKIIERELGIVFFKNWVEVFKESDFTDEKLRGIDKNFCSSIKNCAKNEILNAPALGTLIFIIARLDSDNFDIYTDAFKTIRNNFDEESKVAIDKIKGILLEKESETGKDFTQIRNDLMHPNDITDNIGHYRKWLDKMISRDEDNLLGLICSLKNTVF